MTDNCKRCKVSRANSSKSCQSTNTAVTAITSVRDYGKETSRTFHDDQDQVDGLKFIGEKDMKNLHMHIPALGRKDVQMSAIRQHYYPEGGWGWVVVFCCFLANLLTVGNYLSAGVLALEIKEQFKKENVLECIAIPLVSWSVSLLVSPLSTHLARKYSVRLLSVIGGLVLNMAFLFASFGSQLHQVAVSYGLLFGLASGCVRDTSSMMVGQYFKQRRLLVEIFVSSGNGVGVVIFYMLYRQCIKSLSWRLGLQSMQGLFILAFFLGLFYRSASLYHPQRDAISHIKHQKEKVKSKNKEDNGRKKEKFPVCELAILANSNTRKYIISLSLAGGGLFTPVFYMPLHLQDSGVEEMTSLLGAWLGVSIIIGVIVGGMVTIQESWHFYASSQIIVVFSLMLSGISIFCIYCVTGFHAYVLATSLYGFSLGMYFYISRVFCYRLVKTRDFCRAWSLVQAGQSIPMLIGVIITGLINQNDSKPGYWISIFCVVLGGWIVKTIPCEMVEKAGWKLPTVTEQEEDDMEVRIQELDNLVDFNNHSMSCNSKVDKFLNNNDNSARNDVSRESNLRKLSIYSYSEPERLPDIVETPAIGDKFSSVTFSLSGRVKNPNDILVIDQITSTV